MRNGLPSLVILNIINMCFSEDDIDSMAIKWTLAVSNDQLLPEV